MSFGRLVQAAEAHMQEATEAAAGAAADGGSQGGSQGGKCLPTPFQGSSLSCGPHDLAFLAASLRRSASSLVPGDVAECDVDVPPQPWAAAWPKADDIIAAAVAKLAAPVPVGRRLLKGGGAGELGASTHCMLLSRGRLGCAL